MFTIALRVLWNGGVARIAVEQARNAKAKLLVYRESFYNYDLSGIYVEFLRRKGEKGFLTPLFRKITEIYAKNRGDEATVDLDLIVKASRIIKEPALFHDQFAGITGYLRKVFHGEDYAIYLHETSLTLKGIKYLIPKVMERKVLEGAKIILTNSQWNKRVLEDKGMGAEVLYPGCYTIDEVKEDKENFVLAVSMWDEGRRPEIYGEIAKRIKGRLIMAGSWARRDTMEEFKRKYPEVIVTDRISEDKLRELYKKASLTIRFGFDERGPGMAVLESLCNGTAVIVNDGLGGKEFVIEGENGYVIKDWKEAVDRINEVLENHKLRRSLSINALETGKKYSWRNHAIKLTEIMEKIA
ncbi:glycosyltransferase family 4 protein [Saccharolobus islandicus]|uniref:Glycosyltransferase n=1 Tax=Saccharolobus islandicus LAL14/1 TaxID=1241935 RepID=M9U8E5_SACIS|nr:glycosyltransferase [Sulfolobus islandicus]AGJ62368.1 Glycosyltransferase [Sulfolobus islandicus LAL14/1]